MAKSYPRYIHSMIQLDRLKRQARLGAHFEEALAYEMLSILEGREETYSQRRAFNDQLAMLRAATMDAERAAAAAHQARYAYEAAMAQAQAQKSTRSAPANWRGWLHTGYRLLTVGHP